MLAIHTRERDVRRESVTGHHMNNEGSGPLADCAPHPVPISTSANHSGSDLAAAIERCIRPTRLLTAGGPVHRSIPTQVPIDPAVAVLLCPDHPLPLTRVLVLDDGKRINPAFLRQAIELSSALNAMPILLTVADSEAAANDRQQHIRGLLGSDHACAGLDCLVGSRDRSAVVHIAGWRRCQLVIMQRPAARSWWRRSPAADRACPEARAHDLALLSLPNPLARHNGHDGMNHVDC